VRGKESGHSFDLFVRLIRESNQNVISTRRAFESLLA
jgi:hypothetical protein